MSHIRSGHYNWGTGMLYRQVTVDFQWSSNVISSAHGYYLYVDGKRLIKDNSHNKRLGNSLRCISATQRRATPKRLISLPALNKRVLRIARL